MEFNGETRYRHMFNDSAKVNLCKIHKPCYDVLVSQTCDVCVWYGFHV